jgi:tRNA dimethylallyltransferase
MSVNATVPSLLAIVGPTASGKSALAIEIAKKYHGEIICADSRTIYRGLDVGTAKPSQHEQDGILHFGLNLVEPDQTFSAADFQKYAFEKIEEIRTRDHLPILVGGSGLYIDSVMYSYEFGGAGNAVLRTELEMLSVEELQTRIEASDFEMPENKQNKRYLIRAIEQEGVNRKKSPLLSGACLIGLNPNREVLVSRIVSRATAMIKDGVLEEARLLEENYGWDTPGASGNIYQALRPFIEGETDNLEQCLSDFVQLDKKLAKRQLTWFRRNKDVRWFEDAMAAVTYVDSLLARKA